VLAIVAGACACAAAHAADVRWSERIVQYATVEPKDLRVFLRELAAQQGMAVSIDPEVKGELTGRYSLSPRSMMELLARTFGLVWYFDGKVLHVAPSTAVESDVIRLSESTPAQFQRSLERLGIADSRYPLTVDPDRSTVMVSGPRRMVELVRQAAAATERRSGNGEAPLTSTRVIPLRYALAEDHMVRSSGKEYRVPGVVSILRQTFAPGWRGAPGRGMVVAEAAATGREPVLPVLSGSRRGIGSSVAGAAGSSGASGTSAGFADEGPAPVPNAAAQLPSFAADPRLAAYEELIRSLDDRPRLVELEVNIIEVNGDDFASLGIDWKVLGSDLSVETGSGRIAGSVNNPRGTTPDPVVPLNPAAVVGSVQGAVFALITGNRPQFIARVSALEQGGRANVRAQPRLLTLNNVEAVLESTNTFYVRVEGFQDAQLFDVNVGTAVRLTPSVVGGTVLDADKPDELSQLVRLLVRIEDGSLTDQTIDRLPVVQRSNISTQAVVLDGSTLLIAGYSQELQRESRTGVPGLSKLPLVGGLFRSKSSTKQRVERLFMITPRVVDLAKAGIAKPAPIGMGTGLGTAMPQP
jgi:type III secretion protein C